MVFKSLILSTLYIGLETMVVSPPEYKRLDVGILGFARKLMRGAATSKQLQMQAQHIALLRYKNNGGGQVCLLLRLNFALLACVSFSVCQTTRMVAGPSLLHCLVGSLLMQMIPYLMESWMNERTLGLRSSGKTFKVSRKLVKGIFLLLLDGRIMDIFGRWGIFRILDCSELLYRYLNITVEPPECLAAGTVVPVHAFPEVVPRPSGQEIPEEPEAHTLVCDCTREGGLLRGAKFSNEKQLSTQIMHTEEELMAHVRGACAQQLPMFARGVSSSSPTALQCYVTY